MAQKTRKPKASTGATGKSAQKSRRNETETISISSRDNSASDDEEDAEDDNAMKDAEEEQPNEEGYNEDEQMADTDDQGVDGAEGAHELELDQDGQLLNDGYDPFFNQIKVLPGDTDTAASFQFTNEDHTLGNALRHVIIKNPDVEFCGYTIPHPSDPKMNLRIQTYDNVSVYDVLAKGLQDLQDACDVVLDKFVTARDEFVASQTDES